MTRGLSSSSLRDSFSTSSTDLDLRCEMEELRCSTKSELLKAWAEIEQLEEEKALVLKENMELTSLLQASSDREAVLERRLKDMQLLLGDSDEPEVSVGKAPSGLGIFLGRHPSSRFKQGSNASVVSSISQSHKGTKAEESSNRRPTWPNRRASAIESEKLGLDEALNIQIESLEREKKELIEELERKISCRDTALQSFQRTQQSQKEAIRDLRAQIKKRDNEAAQREADQMEELDILKKNNRRAANREARMKEELELMKQKLKGKRKLIAHQEDKMREYRAYIEDVTTQLETIMRYRDDSVIAEPTKESLCA